MAGIYFFDLTDNGNHLYLFEKGRGGWSLVRNIDITLDGYNDLKPAASDTVLVSLPLSLLNFRLLELPFSDIEKIRDILPFQMEGLILDRDAIIDVCLLKPDHPEVDTVKRTALAAYVHKDRLRKVLEDLKAFDADPEIVTSLDLRAAVSTALNPAAVVDVLFNNAVVEKKDRPGLASEEIENNSVNLRKGELAYTKKKEDIKKSLRLTAALYLLLFFVVISGLTLKIFTAKKEIEGTRSEIRKMYMQMFPEDKKVSNEVYQAKARIKELTEKRELVAGLSPLANLLNISRISGQGVVFNEITMDRTNVTLKGEAPSLGDIQKVKTGLEGAFANIDISDSKNASPNRIVFTITAKEKK